MCQSNRFINGDNDSLIKIRKVFQKMLNFISALQLLYNVEQKCFHSICLKIYHWLDTQVAKSINRHNQRLANKLIFKVQIANPQTLGLISLSQNRKFLRCASPQIAIPQIFMINPQIRKFLKNTAQHKTVL
jgi:hypothetical protein